MISGSTQVRMVRRLLSSEYLVLALCLALFAALGPVTPGFVSARNLGNLLGSLMPLLVVSVGQTLVLVAGGIDLSVTATIAITSVAGAFVMNGDDGWLRGSPAAGPVAVLVMLVVGALVGAVNGLAIARLAMPAFMVTLTTMMFVSGLAVLVTHSEPMYRLPAAFTLIGANTWLAALVTVVFVGGAHVILSRSLFGQWVRAVGHNARTAIVSGVPVAAVVVGTYVASGVFAAAASVLYTARLETGSPVMGQRILLDVVGAAVIGGTSLFGGRGKVTWTVFGVLFLTALDNALNLLGLSHFAIMMLKGGVIVVAAWLDALRTRWLAA